MTDENTTFEKIRFDDIIPADYNPRILSEEEYSKLRRSMNRWGLVDPIIINLQNNHIIGGHQRYEVLLNDFERKPFQDDHLLLLRRGDIGWVFTDNDLKLDSLEDEKALNIALNKISGDWDYPKLNLVLGELTNLDFDVSLTGFDDLDLSHLNEELDMDLGDTDVDLLDEPSYKIIVEFTTEEAQSELFNRLVSEGYDVRMIAEN